MIGKAYQFIVVKNSGEVRVGFHGMQEQVTVVSSNSKNFIGSNFCEPFAKIRRHGYYRKEKKVNKRNHL
jgi:hypothetical protein